MRDHFALDVDRDDLAAGYGISSCPGAMGIDISTNDQLLDDAARLHVDGPDNAAIRSPTDVTAEIGVLELFIRDLQEPPRCLRSTWRLPMGPLHVGDKGPTTQHCVPTWPIFTSRY
jgi:hypothetical protein